jgi:hypothetical protein
MEENTESKEIPKEELKLMYDTVCDELNRGRDWPIKIMAFTSAAYLALFSLLKLDNNHLGLNCWVKSLFTIILLYLLRLTIKIIIKQHLNYLEYRNIQIRLQKVMKIKDWKIDNEDVFPAHWNDTLKISTKTGFQGWSFYATYIIIIAIITLVLIWSF